MCHIRTMRFLLGFGAFIQGVHAQVQTIAAKVGGDALLKCNISKSEEVVHVTWQKTSPEINLATNSKYYTALVIPEFRPKVEFKDTGLQNSSIIIRNVKQQDEGCYNCLFNIDRYRTIVCKTCLQVYELNEPILHVNQSSSTAEFLVSCSVSGRPPPTVTLTSVQGQSLSHYSTVTVPDTNGTVTVNATAVLSALHTTKTTVKCLVRPAFGSETVVIIRNITGFDENPLPSDHDGGRTRISVFVVLFVFVFFDVPAPIILRHKKHLKRSSEKNEDEEVGMELEDIHGTPTNRTLNTQHGEENEMTSNLRNRSSAEKNSPKATPEHKPSAARKLFLRCEM